jgi:hypothetical protein
MLFLTVIHPAFMKIRHPDVVFISTGEFYPTRSHQSIRGGWRTEQLPQVLAALPRLYYVCYL